MDTMSEVMDLARKYAPKFKGFGFTGEDVIQEFYVKFTTQGFLGKYDGKKSSLNRYVFVGMRNVAIDFSRRYGRVKSCDWFSEADERSYVGSDHSDLLSNLVGEEILAKVPAIPFGYSKVFEFDGETYHSTYRSVAALLMKDFTRKDIAIAFGVSVSTVDKVMVNLRPVLAKYLF